MSPTDEFGEDVKVRVEVEPGVEKISEDGVTASGGEETMVCFLGVAKVEDCDFGDGGDVSSFRGGLTGIRNVTLRFCPEVISQDKGTCDI